jgi:hypothetical protein
MVLEEHNNVSFLFCSACASTSVNIGVRVSRRTAVDHNIYVIDIQTPGSHIRSNKDVEVPCDAHRKSLSLTAKPCEAFLPALNWASV